MERATKDRVTQLSTKSDADRIDDAINQFSQIGERDPHRVTWSGAAMPRQLGESASIWQYIQHLNPSPSVALQLAAHCQHLRRFAYPRSAFAAGRDGYLAWRTQAARQSADEAAAILRRLGFDETIVEPVVAIITKQDRRQRPDVQTMEDALCLTFFRLEANDFAAKHDLADVQKILRRSWLKMSQAGRTLALSESYAEPLGRMLADLDRETKTKPGSP